MVYPWSRKTKKEETPPEEEEIKNNELSDNEENSNKEAVEEDKNSDSNEISEETNEIWDNEDPRAIMLNILKLEGYKMDSGELYNAFKEASTNKSEAGIMEDFKTSLEALSNLRKIKSDSDGNIMTNENFDREKSQTKTDAEEVADESSEEKTNESSEEENNAEEVADESSEEEGNAEEKTDKSQEENSDDLESIIKLKEETDSWLIEKLKNNGKSEESKELRIEVEELKDRVQKLEKIIKNLTRAFE